MCVRFFLIIVYEVCVCIYICGYISMTVTMILNRWWERILDYYFVVAVIIIVVVVVVVVVVVDVVVVVVQKRRVLLTNGKVVPYLFDGRYADWTSD